jgi:ATP-dependent DNA ligase
MLTPSSGLAQNKKGWNGEGLAKLAGALALGLEIIVAKDAKSPYIEGPRETSYWLKIKDKNYKRQEKIEIHPRKRTR